MTMDDKDKIRWFVMYTSVHQEKKAAERLSAMCVEHFVATRRAKHKWSDRMKWIDEILIPGIIFVRTDEAGRLNALKDVPQLVGSMWERGTKSPAAVPDKEMDNFIRICDQHYESFNISNMAVGDKVEIVDGPLSGMEGILTKCGGQHQFSVKVPNIGYATITVDPASLRKLETPDEN